MLKIGIIKETKEPTDARVVITPALIKEVKDKGFNIVVQRSELRCIPDSNYEQVGAELVDDVTDCDILIGVKEVKEKELIPDKTYFFFSHTHKEQAYNRSLLQVLVDKHIRMIDYEVLTNSNGQRIIAFGKFAGMVGAHNALWTYNQRFPSFEMERMNTYDDYQQAVDNYSTITFPNIKIVLTGTGRVGNGAAMVLKDMGIQKVSPKDFIEKKYNYAVFTQLACEEYVARKDGKVYDKKDFYTNPNTYKSIFSAYTEIADIMINGIFWDTEAPVFFTKEDMKSANFNIKTVADVTCDIAPISSIPSTLYPTTIKDPAFTYNCISEEADEAFSTPGVDMMTIDNLPNELPVDASNEFGRVFVDKILPEFLKEQSDILDRATLCKDGKITKQFSYLESFLKE